MVWSGLHERVITLRGLREHTVRLQLAEWSLHFYYRMLDSRSHPLLQTRCLEPGGTELPRVDPSPPTSCTQMHCQHISHDALCPAASN